MGSRPHSCVVSQPAGGYRCQLLNPLKEDELASGLHLNSVSLDREAALASQSDASGHLTSAPSWLSMPNQERSQSTENVLPRHGLLAWNPLRSVGKEPGGEPSLSGKPECLSLHTSLLPERTQTGKEGGIPSHRVKASGSLCRVFL